MCVCREHIVLDDTLARSLVYIGRRNKMHIQRQQLQNTEPLGQARVSGAVVHPHNSIIHERAL